jgi:hypothetical protein
MNEVERAEEHLRIIRTLMERATIYRAISAPTALVGGLLAAITSAGSLIWMHGENAARLPHFVGLWIFVLVITVCANTLFVWRAARKRDEPMISSAMKTALRALFPSLLAGAALSIFALCNVGDVMNLIVLFWVLFYGLALLATAHFAPKSLVLLGWAFLIAAMFCLFLSPKISGAWPMLSRDTFALIVMGLTFGLFHLVYAVCTWPRKAHDAESQ